MSEIHIANETKSTVSVEDYDLGSNPGHLLRRAQQVGVATFSKIVGMDIRPRQFALMITVSKRPGLHQVDYMRDVGMDRSTISDVVERLEKRGFLERRKEDGDDRTANLYVTTKGQEAIDQTLPFVRKMEQELRNKVPEHLQAPFIEALKAIAESD